MGCAVWPLIKLGEAHILWWGPGACFSGKPLWVSGRFRVSDRDRHFSLWTYAAKTGWTSFREGKGERGGVGLDELGKGKAKEEWGWTS